MNPVPFFYIPARVRDTVDVARLTAGIRLNARWEFSLSYAMYGDTIAQFSLQQNPTLVYIWPPDRPHDRVRIQNESVSVLAAYRHPLTQSISVHGGAGLSRYSMETNWSGGVLMGMLPPRPMPSVMSEEDSLSPTATVGADYAFNERVSLSLGYRYSRVKIDLLRSNRLSVHEFELGVTGRF